jgi:isopentenyl-diphosphate Delta-isomerase
MYKRIQIVDEKDNVIGSEYLFPAIEKGYIRRAARVFVFDTEGKLLIQKRSKKVRKPLLFDQSAAGHLDEGESYMEAAMREMKEEIGLTNIELKEIVTSYRTKEFFNGVYKAVVPPNTELTVDPEEVESMHWMAVDEVDRRIREEPETFTDGFLEIWSGLRDKILAR